MEIQNEESSTQPHGLRPTIQISLEQGKDDDEEQFLGAIIFLTKKKNQMTEEVPEDGLPETKSGKNDVANAVFGSRSRSTSAAVHPRSTHR